MIPVNPVSNAGNSSRVLSILEVETFDDEQEVTNRTINNIRKIPVQFEFLGRRNMFTKKDLKERI